MRAARVLRSAAGDALFASHANHWKAASQRDLVAALVARGLLSDRVAEAPRACFSLRLSSC